MQVFLNKVWMLFIISVISFLFSTMPSKKAKWRKKYDKENEPKPAKDDSKGKQKSRLFRSVHKITFHMKHYV